MASKRHWRATLYRWTAFNIVGLSGVAVQLATLTALVSFGCHYLIATAIAVEAAVLNNFFWHERWTWTDRAEGGLSETLDRLLRFNLSVGVISIVQNLFFMNVLVRWLGIPYLPANLMGIASCSLLNFFLSDRLVFSRPGVAAVWSRESV